MSDERISKPKSFRIDDATAEQFKKIAAETGGNQQEVMAKLIEAYELQKAKAIIPGKINEIEKFEKYTSILIRMYMSALEDNENMAVTVRTEYEAQLTSKDMTIQDLQAQLITAKQIKENAVEKAKSLTDEISKSTADRERAEKEFVSRIKNLETMLADKEKLNNTLTDACAELREKAEKSKADADAYYETAKELDAANQRYDKAANEISALKKENEQQLAQLEQAKIHEQEELKRISAEHKLQLDQTKTHEQEELKRVNAAHKLQLDQTLLDLERKHHQEIQKIEKEKQDEINLYQKKYLALLEQINNLQKSFKAE